ncbi:MAG: hypothetical protein SFY92_11635 [Verrucomicrobiae bacterium]|nr:hypothetical protein [Verrucomicrobiae bacterium]
MDFTSLLLFMEMLSYLVTVIGLPLAIYTFATERRKERANDEEEIYLDLAEAYNHFLILALDNSDLQLLRRQKLQPTLDLEQSERRFALFGILVSLFERAYILTYEENMDREARRRWMSWDDYMREWCRRPEFRDELPDLLWGEDNAFCQYISRVAEEEKASSL